MHSTALQNPLKLVLFPLSEETGEFFFSVEQKESIVTSVCVRRKERSERRLCVKKYTGADTNKQETKPCGDVTCDTAVACCTSVW